MHDSFQDDGFVWIRSGGVFYVSVYLSPNEGIAVFRQKLERLEDVIRDMDGEVVMAGDFNAKATEWGMDSTCSRGSAVVELAARMDLVILNTGGAATFRRPGCHGTIIDISLATSGAASRIHGWRVLEDFTGSDHQYLKFTLEHHRNVSNHRTDRESPRGWNASRLDRARLCAP